MLYAYLFFLSQNFIHSVILSKLIQNYLNLRVSFNHSINLKLILELCQINHYKLINDILPYYIRNQFIPIKISTFLRTIKCVWTIITSDLSTTYYCVICNQFTTFRILTIHFWSFRKAIILLKLNNKHILFVIYIICKNQL